MPRRVIAMVKEIEPTYLTVAGVQRYLGFGNVDTQREWRDKGRLPFYIVGRQILYRKADIDKFVERHRITPIGTTKLEIN